MLAGVQLSLRLRSLVLVHRHQVLQTLLRLAVALDIGSQLAAESRSAVVTVSLTLNAIRSLLVDSLTHLSGIYVSRTEVAHAGTNLGGCLVAQRQRLAVRASTANVRFRIVEVVEHGIGRFNTRVHICVARKIN